VTAVARVTLKKAAVSHHEAEVRELRADPGLAVAYLKAAMAFLDDPEDRAAGLLALRTVAEAYGGLGAVAAEAGISRESLYRALSPRGNPTLKTLLAVLKTVGMRLSVEPVQRQGSDPGFSLKRGLTPVRSPGSPIRSPKPMPYPKLTHHGGATGVTGSCHRLQLAADRALLVDCGLFKGQDAESSTAPLGASPARERVAGAAANMAPGNSR